MLLIASARSIQSTTMQQTLSSFLIDLTTIRLLQSDLRMSMRIVSLEHFRICEVMEGLTSQPLYEVENSAYLSEMLMTGMRELYSSSLNVRHYAISTTEHIIDVLTAESYIIE